jgi:hypothetical protein
MSQFRALPIVHACTVAASLRAPAVFLQLYAWGYCVLDGVKFQVFMPSRQGIVPNRPVRVFCVGPFNTYIEAVTARDLIVQQVAQQSMCPCIQLGSRYGIKVYHPVLQKQFEHERGCVCCFCEAILDLSSTLSSLLYPPPSVSYKA